MNKRRVLIIDDDARNIFALSATLRAKGYDCLTARDMEEAMHLLLSDTQIDIILLDMMMPETDGYEAIPLIRSIEKGKNMPVIAVTAQVMPGDREKSLEAGADEYISKPVDVDRMLHILGMLLK